jgi:hypothetical protein
MNERQLLSNPAPQHQILAPQAAADADRQLLAFECFTLTTVTMAMPNATLSRPVYAGAVPPCFTRLPAPPLCWEDSDGTHIAHLTDIQPSLGLSIRTAAAFGRARCIGKPLNLDGILAPSHQVWLH